MMTQYVKRNNKDWIVQMEKDFEDFEIPFGFEYLISKTEEEFKRIVKKQATIYQFKKSSSEQEKHSKTMNLNFSDLDLQPYLLRKDLTKDQKKTVFQWRTKMARFGENYRGGRSFVICPICHTHRDYQEESFTCKRILRRITINVKYEDLFKDTDSDLPKVASVLTKIDTLRKQLLES